MARSLIDGSGFDSIGRRAAPRSRRLLGRERAKAALAASMLAVAFAILSWHFGLLPAPRGPVLSPASPEDVRERLRQEDEIKKGIERKGGVIGSS